MHPKLLWVPELTRSLGLAMATSISHVIENTVDPLMKSVVLTFGDPMRKGDYNPLQQMIHAFAKANDCIVQKIRKGTRTLTIEVSTKTRLGPVMKKNPLTGV